MTTDDARFAHLTTDPRYRLPGKRQNRVTLDSRFAHILKDDNFARKAQVDRYGRPLSGKSGRKQLERFYQLENEEDDEVDDDEDVQKELKRVERDEQDELYDPARQGGFDESSSSEEESSEEEESEVEELTDARGTVEDIPQGEVTYRIAAVNMDWDNVRAIDLMAVAGSFCPSSGKIVDVTVYPSEFGREQMDREQLEGPPKELFEDKKKRHQKVDKARYEEEEEEDHAQSPPPAPDEGDETNEVDSKAFRNYQLSRLRYYYAVITCDSPPTAYALYNEMDSREYLTSANFFDLRFIPDDTTFNDPITDKPRDTCTTLPPGYKPNDFVTEALTHSRVKLTWDAEDKGRQEAQKRAFSRAEIDENDLKAYVGSESSSEEEPQEPAPNQVPQSKESSKEEQRRKTRALLGLPEEEAPSKAVDTVPQGDMQITFSAGLSNAQNGESIFDNKPEDVKEETTMERYVRKEKERKARRKEKMKAKRHGGNEPEATSGEAPVTEKTAEPEIHKSLPAEKEAQEEDPFNDTFFTDPAAANEKAKRDQKKEKKKRETLALKQTEAQRAQERENLRNLLNDNGQIPDGEHFDMAVIRKQEKEAARKGKKKHKKAKRRDDEEEVKADDFKPDLDDPRFKAMFEQSEFAIDPTNPRYSGTKAMQAILEEGRKTREQQAIDVPVDSASANGSNKKRRGDDDLDGLVDKLKKKKQVAT